MHDTMNGTQRCVQIIKQSRDDVGYKEKKEWNKEACRSAICRVR